MQRPAVLTVAATVLVLIYLVPVYWMVATSLKLPADVFATPPDIIPSPATLQAYADTVLSDPAVWSGLRSSAIITLPALALTLVLSAPAAYALAKYRFRITGAVLFLLLAAQMLPTISLALPLFAIFSQYGLVDTYTGLIIANVSVTLPFAVVLLRPYMGAIPGELLEAARLDGCSIVGAFLRVGLPLARPGLIMVATLTFVMTWGEFVFGLTLATSDDKQPITVVLNRFIASFGTQWTNLMAVSTVIAIPIIVVFIALQKHVVAGLAEGGLKD
ncbi:carbohydrate ABC transporter permease [Brachybacterium sp. YJGR34]|uniref:carbohydrate ABC transporter permease n=1 Tax=Brachybacterium sp. YJGR34 TaxID=2059911 RepID=UPI000E0BB008|nr:carbohydrate ABC transporter permease [Brachybacterium sp. YJGR34]